MPRPKKDLRPPGDRPVLDAKGNVVPEYNITVDGKKRKNSNWQRIVADMHRQETAALKALLVCQ